MREFWHKHIRRHQQREEKKQMSWFLCHFMRQAISFSFSWWLFNICPCAVLFLLCTVPFWLWICLHLFVYTRRIELFFRSLLYTCHAMHKYIHHRIFFVFRFFFFNIVRNSSFFRVWMESYAVRLFHIPLTLRKRNAWSIILKRNSINWMWHNLHVSCRTFFNLIEKIQFFAISSCSRFFFGLSYFPIFYIFE